MIRGLYIAVSGMVVGEAKQSVITNNISNSNTTGYKVDNLNVKNFKDVMISNHDKINNGMNVKNKLGKISIGSAIDDISTYYTQGIQQFTEKDTDMAIEGRGFFTVDRGGKEYYSRDGHFSLNQNGELVNDSGDLLKGYDLYTGISGNINVGDEKFTVSEEGNITVNGMERYKLQMTDFGDYGGLEKIGDNLYEGTNPIAVNDVIVKQKYIEKSNVNIIKEAINMMENSRIFESNQKVVQVMDETLGKAVNDVGRI